VAKEIKETSVQLTERKRDIKPSERETCNILKWPLRTCKEENASLF
jgi:hypothetical protein